MKTEKEFNKIHRTMMWWANEHSKLFLEIRRLNRKIKKLKKEKKLR